jgi:glucose/arabinose dehydrogenase
MLRPLLIVLAFVAACGRSRDTAGPGCDDSIKLPPGFCAKVFYDSVGPARHLVVRKNGDVIVGVLDQRREAGGIVLLRDSDKDGRADAAQKYGESGVHGLVLAGDSVLYASTASEVLRYRLTDSLLPKRRVDTIVTGLARRQIPSHSLALDRRGNLIVNIGALSNGCAARELPGAPGRDPCPDLIASGGIWAFRTDRTGQHTLDGTRIATGLHNAVALAVNPADTMVYAVSHGRDELHDLWPALYSDEESATLAAEEMVRIATPRADFGWPYCYYDFLKQSRVLAPEYGGNKETVGRCERLIQPLISFPAHWAPMSMLFYTGKMFPPNYQGGVFVAFHGSSFRAPLAQDGYQVVFMQFKDGLPSDYSIFASGFTGPMVSPEGALHRPVGLAQGPDGAVYLSDDKGGRIWKIVYKAQH